MPEFEFPPNLPEWFPWRGPHGEDPLVHLLEKDLAGEHKVISDYGDHIEMAWVSGSEVTARLLKHIQHEEEEHARELREEILRLKKTGGI